MTGPRLRVAGVFIFVPGAFVTLCMIPDAKGMAVLVWFAIAAVVACLAFYCAYYDDPDSDAWMMSRNEWKAVKARRKARA